MSPMAHADPIGTIFFPLMSLVMRASSGGSAPLFGWAKPVRFNPARFNRKFSLWQGTALAALAGPAANLILAFAAALALRVMGMAHIYVEALAHFLVMLIQLNCLLAVFNLFPLPPLDGGHLIPDSFGELKDALTRGSFLIFLVLFFVPIPGVGQIGWRIIGPIVAAIQMPLVVLAGG